MRKMKFDFVLANWFLGSRSMSRMLVSIRDYNRVLLTALNRTAKNAKNFFWESFEKAKKVMT
jgi:hypothetical protein